MDFTAELNRKIETCNNWLTELAPKGDGYHSMIYDAMNYSINAGGKRVRPVLALAVCEMLGGDPNTVRHFACAVEFIHTYSLIHDDLPCMDDDDMRRGIPTSHIKYGEALAVLAGDALLNYAFETALKSNSDKTIKQLRILSEASGACGMIGGQVIDMKGVREYDELLTLHRMKTGALFSAAAAMGAVAGGADDALKSSILKFADNLGLAFQVRDDILDVEGNAEVLGKKIGSDDISGKITFVTLLGIDEAKARLAVFTETAKSALEIFGDKAEFLCEFADYLLSREN